MGGKKVYMKKQTFDFRCDHCLSVKKTNNHRQHYCDAFDCQKERIRRNTENHIIRRAKELNGHK